MFPQGDTTGPKSRELVFPEGGNCRSKYPTRLPTGGDRQCLAFCPVQLERILAFSHQRAKGTRGEKPWVWIRAVIPYAGVPARGYNKSKVPRPGVAGQAHNSPKIPHGFIPFFRILHRQSGVVLAAPTQFSTVVPFAHFRRRLVILLRGAVFDGREDRAF